MSCSQRPGEVVVTVRVAASPEEGAEHAHPQFSLDLGMTSALQGRGAVRPNSCPPRPQPARATSIPASSLEEVRGWAHVSPEQAQPLPSVGGLGTHAAAWGSRGKVPQTSPVFYKLSSFPPALISSQLAQ